MNRWSTFFFLAPLLSLLIYSVGTFAQTEDVLLQLNVNVGSRSFSKLPFLIAKDQGLYTKYGLDVDLRLGDLQFEGGVVTDPLFRRRELDIRIGGLSPNIMRQITIAGSDRIKAIGSTDCNTRAVIVGKKDDSLPYDFKNKRIGVSAYYTTTHYVANLLAKRLGLDPIQDISIILRARTYQELEDDEVDLVVMAETRASVAIQEGFNILEDTSKWQEPIAGNSILVTDNWLRNEKNHEKAIRFLKASAEALTILHKDKDLTLKILTKWYGIKDPELLDLIYKEAEYMPKIPYVCEEGVNKTLEMYRSFNTMQYNASDFYDKRFMTELEESGFLDNLNE